MSTNEENDIASNDVSSKIQSRHDNIIKPQEDKRFYRALQLCNDMKVLLISDPLTDKSAAAMDVNVGYLSDPDNIPGLAHFCEHMLFLGTEKYPKENEYNKFISEHGGSSNAFTTADHTTYYFDVAPEHLPGALDIFAQFFICPLFTESATEREMNAVNSEHDKNTKSDLWRLDQLNKSTADPRHPYSKFGTGNIETLQTTPKAKNIDVRKALLEFHNKYYSADIMCCSVLGKESLDELEKLVVPLLSSVKSKGVTAPVWEQSPYPDELCRKRALVHPVKELRSLSVNIPIPDWTKHYRSAPGNYISYLVGHEGPGSLLSVLRSRHWCNSLVGGGRVAGRGFSLFGVQVDLTEEGVQHTDDIVKLIFQYIAMLKADGPQMRIFEEQRDLNAMEFRFRDTVEPRSLVGSTAHSLQEYPPEEVLSHAYLITEWREDLIKELLDMLTPDRVRIAIVSKSFADKCTETERWYGTKYVLEDIPEKTLEEWRNPGVCEDLHLPLPNEFIPSRLDLQPREESTQDHTPSIILDSPRLRLWYKQDNEFLLPKAIIHADFHSPLAYSEPQSVNMLSVWCLLLKDSLVEYTYAAELAGLRYNVSNSKSGISVMIEGYDDKMHVLFDKVLEKVSSHKVERARFDIMKELYERALRSSEADQPYKHAIYHQTLMLTDHAWSRKQMEECLPGLKVEMLEAFTSQLMRRVHCEILALGNLTRDRALDFADIVEKRLPTDGVPLLAQQLLLSREVDLEKGSHYMRRVENSVHSGCCALLYFPCSRQETERNAVLEMLQHIISEPCFNLLRTQEQLGYIVFSGLRRSHGTQGLRILVQSDREPEYVEDRVEAFLKYMEEYITSMADDELERHRAAIRSQLLERPKKLTQRASAMLSEMSAQQYNFDRARVEADALLSVTRGQLLDAYKKYIWHGSPERKKLSIHIVSTLPKDAEVKENKISDTLGQPPARSVEPIIVTDVIQFKCGRALCPNAPPFINIPRKGAQCKL